MVWFRHEVPPLSCQYNERDAQESCGRHHSVGLPGGDEAETVLVMPTHVAFLRAINLGRNRKLPMTQVKECLAEAGFTGVETYLGTGNVRVETPKRSRRVVEQAVEQALSASAGFDVPTIVFSPKELASVHEAAVRLGVSAQRRYVTFLRDEPPAALATELDGWSAPGEGATVLGRAVYWWIDHPNAAAKMSNARVERQLGTATTRDIKVVTTLVERWCS
jgi:uncharacterized protein (DUF1697 family)